MCVCVSSCNYERPADTLGILQRIAEIGHEHAQRGYGNLKSSVGRFFPLFSFFVLSGRPRVCRDNFWAGLMGAVSARRRTSSSLLSLSSTRDWRLGDGRVLPRTIAEPTPNLVWRCHSGSDDVQSMPDKKLTCHMREP